MNIPSFFQKTASLFRTLVLMITLFCLCYPHIASGQTQLMLDNNLHNGVIRQVVSDFDGLHFATRSAENGIKLWDANTYEHRRTIFVPVAQDLSASITDMAFSSDGSQLFVVGYWESDLTGTENEAFFMAFSSQTGNVTSIFPIKGKQISGIGVIDLESVALIHADRNGVILYSLESQKEVSFLKSEVSADQIQIASAGYGVLAGNLIPNELNILDNKGRVIHAFSLPNGAQVQNISFNYLGTQLAVGFRNFAQPLVFSLDTKTVKMAPQSRGLSLHGFLNQVGFLRSGKVMAGGNLSDNRAPEPRAVVRFWDDFDSGIYTDISTARGTITGFAPIGDKMVVTSSYPSITILDDNGRIVKHIESEQFQFSRSDRSNFRVSEDALRIGFHPAYGARTLFNVMERTFFNYDDNLEPFSEELANGSKILDWKFGRYPKIGKSPISLQDKEMTYSVDSDYESSIAYLGTNLGIKKVDSKAKILWSTATSGMIWNISKASRAKVLATSQSDGTLRWYSSESGKELLAAFLHPEGNKWIIWTPDGYYDASAGAEELIRWIIPQGKNNIPLSYPSSKFRSSKFSPKHIDDVLKSFLNGEDAPETKVEQSSPLLAENMPPQIRILEPQHGSFFDGAQINVRYEVIGGAEVDKSNIRVLIDGKPASTARKIKLSEEDDSGKFEISVPQKDVKIALIAENEMGFSEPDVVTLYWSGEQDLELLKPNLYVLSIGVGEYKNDIPKLTYPSKDARDFVQAWKLQDTKLYKSVNVRELTGEKATLSAILDGLEWIEKETTSRDVAVIFMAGHGVNDANGVYYYLPSDADVSALKRTALVNDVFRHTINAIAGKTLLFLDTCHSGNVMGDRRASVSVDNMVNELINADNGVVVFTSSTGRQYSLEDHSWQNGAFTKALVEGLSGKADLFNRGKVSVKTLDAYVTDRVKELTRGQQSPTAIIPKSIPDYPLAIVNQP